MNIAFRWATASNSYVGLCPQGSIAAISDFARSAHALQRRSLMAHDAYKSDVGPIFRFSAKTAISWPTRMCLAGLDVGRRVRQHAACTRREEQPARHRRGSDTFDTIDWLVKNVPGHNGRVGMWGISYPGFYTAAGMIDAHPAQAASPQAPVTDWFTGDDWHHNGAFLLPHAFGFMASLGHPRPEPTKTFGSDSTRHARRLRLFPADGPAFATPTPAISRTTFRSGTRSCSTATSMTSGKPGTCART